MSKPQTTLVYYYIPEDHDDPQYPNVLGVKASKNQIRLHHIYDNFPLKGTYIFRFKAMYDNTVAWLDLPDLSAKLPTFKDKIYVKVTRVSWQSSSNPYAPYRQAHTNQHMKQKQPIGNTNKRPQSSSPPQPQKNQQQYDLIGENYHHNHKNDSLL